MRSGSSLTELFDLGRWPPPSIWWSMPLPRFWIHQSFYTSTVLHPMETMSSLLLPHLSSSLTNYLPSLNLLYHLKAGARFMQDGWKAVWSIRYVPVAFFPSLKLNFIAYRSSRVSPRPNCIFEIHQRWQLGFSRVYSNCCCSCWFEPEIIKIGLSSHKMSSNNIVNFQESTTISNACTKKSLETYWMSHVRIYVYIRISNMFIHMWICTDIVTHRYITFTFIYIYIYIYIYILHYQPLHVYPWMMNIYIWTRTHAHTQTRAHAHR